MSKNAIPANVVALPSRRSLLAAAAVLPTAGSAVAHQSALIGAMAVAGTSHPDQQIFDMIGEMQAWIDKANAPGIDDAMTAFYCGKQTEIFGRFLKQAPQTARGIRASLEYLVGEMKQFSYDSDEIRPLIEAVLSSPALAG